MEVIELNFNWMSQEWGLSELIWVERDNDGINEFCILTPCPFIVLLAVGTNCGCVRGRTGLHGIRFTHLSVEYEQLLRIREPREIKRKCWLSCTVLLHQRSHRRVIHFQQIVLWRNIIIIFGIHTTKTLSEGDEIIFCFCFSFTITPNRCLNLRRTEMSWHSARGLLRGLSMVSFPEWGCYCRCFWLRQRNGYFKFILNKQKISFLFPYTLSWDWWGELFVSELWSIEETKRKTKWQTNKNKVPLNL